MFLLTQHCHYNVQNKSQDGIGQKVEKLVPGIEKGLANVNEDLDGPMHEERQGRGRRDDMAAEKIEEQYIHHERDGHRFGKDGDGIDRRGGRERQSRMSGRDTDEQRSRGERSDIVTDSLTRNRTNVRTDDLRRSGGQREEREEGWGGERRRYESPVEPGFADSRSRGRPHDVGPRGPQGKEEMEWRSRGRFRSDERRGDKQTTSGGRNFLDRVEGDVSWRNRGRNEVNGRPERQHRVSRRDADSTRMDVEEELNLPGPPPLRPPLVDGQVVGGEGQVEAVDRIRVEVVTDKMGVKRRRQREVGERVEAAAPNSVDEVGKVTIQCLQCLCRRVGVTALLL